MPLVKLVLPMDVELVSFALMTLNAQIKFRGLTAVQMVLVVDRFVLFQTNLVNLAKMQHSV